MEAMTTPSRAPGPAQGPATHDPAPPLQVQDEPSSAAPTVGPANAVTLHGKLNSRRGHKRAAGSESSASSSTSSHSQSRANGKSAQARHKESVQSLQYPTVSSSTIATPSAATSNSSLRTSGTTGHKQATPVTLPVLVRAYPSPNTPTTATTTATSPVSPNMPRSKRESRKGPKSPPPSAFDFSSILQSITPAVQPSLDSIAEICAKSRMSLASDYQAHLPPHGAGRLETVGEEGGFEGEEGKGKARMEDDGGFGGVGEDTRGEKTERSGSGFASWFPRMQFGSSREANTKEMRAGGGDAIGALRGCLKS